MLKGGQWDKEVSGVSAQGERWERGHRAAREQLAGLPRSQEADKVMSGEVNDNSLEHRLMSGQKEVILSGCVC